MYPFFILLVCFGEIFIFAQTIQAWFEPKSNAHWVLQGKSDLPESTNLVSVLLYEKEEIPYSRQYKPLYQGKFFFDYQAFHKKMPAGQYSWQVASLQAEEGKAIFFEENFYYRTPYEKRKEIREEMLFFINFFAEIREYIVRLKESSKALLEKKQDNTMAKVWLEEIQKNRLSILEKWEKKTEQEAFSRSQEILRQVQDSLQNLQKLSQLITLRILIHYDLSLSTSYMSLKKNYPTEKDQKKNEEKSEKQIRILARQVLSCFPLPGNLTQEDLEQDIVWFNTWFKNLATEYQKAYKNFNSVQWDKKASLALEEIDIFQLCARDYEQSPLNKKYPSLSSPLKSLSQNAKSLLDEYTKQLHQKEKAQTSVSEEIVKNLRKDMESLLQLIQKERQESLFIKEKAAQEAQRCFVLLEKHYIEIQETLNSQDIKEFVSKESYHKAQHQSFLEQILVWQPYLPNHYLSLRKASISLMTRLEFHRYVLQGKLSIHSPQIKSQLKEMDIEIALLMHQIKANGF